MSYTDFHFTGWSGWPVATGDDLHDWSKLIQLWLATYEKQLALGGCNDLPHLHSVIIAGVSIPISDNLAWIKQDGDGSASIPIVGDDAHCHWTGHRFHSHAQHGGTYPGSPENPVGDEMAYALWYSPYPDGEFDFVHWWIDGVWKSLRAIQQWINEHMGEFVEYRNPNYDGYAGRTIDGTFYPDPPTYIPSKLCEIAGIAYDDDSHYFTREYPKEFQFRSSVTFTQRLCDDSTSTVTFGPSTTYVDGSAFVEGDKARCIGNNIEDYDGLTGIMCGDGMGGEVWIPWEEAPPTDSVWREETGRVYQRTSGAWVEVEHPSGAKPDTVTKKGFIQRGDYLTVTLANEIYRALNALRWTLKGIAWKSRAVDATEEKNEKTGSSDLQLNDTTNPLLAAYDGTTDPAGDSRSYVYPANNVETASNPYCSGVIDGSDSAHIDGASLGRRYAYAHAEPQPQGIINPPSDNPFDNHVDNHDATHSMAHSTQFYTWGLCDQFDNPPSVTKVFDANGDTVAYHQWKLFDTKGPEVVVKHRSAKFGSLAKPNYGPNPVDGVPGEDGYFALGIAIQKWDVSGGMSFMAAV